MKFDQKHAIAELQGRLNDLIGSDLAEDGEYGPYTHSQAMLLCERAEQLTDANTIPAPAGDAIPPTQRTGSQEMHAVKPLSLSELALNYAIEECRKWAGKPVPKERVAEYLEGCERKGVNIGRDLAAMVRVGQHVAFCAAAFGWCEEQATKSGAFTGAEIPLHRAGAQEPMFDAKRGMRFGQRWLGVADVLAGASWPRPGSAAVYINTHDSNHGHIERVVEADARGYRSVGANEHGGTWFEDADFIPYHDAEAADRGQPLKLLGFIVDV